MERKSAPIIQELRENFSNKFLITTEKEKPFPFCGTQYEPDIVLWSKDTSSVLAIIEVEQGTRKHMVGGAITADYCMKQSGHFPYFFVLSLKPNYKEDYRKRIPMLKSYVTSLQDIFVGDKDEVIEKVNRL